MAEVLESFDFSPKQRGGYPFDEWTDGRIWQVVRGKDFTCTIHGFTTYMRMKAKELNCPINVKVRGDTVTFQFVRSS